MDSELAEVWFKETNGRYRLFVLPTRKAGLIEDDEELKCFMDVDLSKDRNSKAVAPALKYAIKLILASPNPILSFQTLRLLMSFAKLIGANEVSRQVDLNDELQSALCQIRGFIGAEKSLATRQKKLEAKWTIEARALAKDFTIRHPNCTARQLAGHIAMKIKGAPGDRAIRKWLKKVGTEPPFRV
jgi:hypothetical protein